MESKTKTKTIIDKLEKMFSVGAHFGYQRTRRHPSVKPFIFGNKNRVDIIDLDKSGELLDSAKLFIKDLARTGKIVLFVGTKPESRQAIMEAAQSIDMPYVTERWIGGTLTNFGEIRRRVEKLADLTKKKEEGALSVYTKKERSLIDREMADLEKNFGGLALLRNTPSAVFVVDSKRESIAVTEALKMDVPVISLSNSDCDVSKITYPIIANDSSVTSISYFTSEIASAYKDGRSEGVAGNVPAKSTV